MSKDTASRDAVSRRDFLRSSAAGTIGLSAALHATGARAWAAGSDTLRVGVIGCGGRGTGAARDAAVADPGVRIVALGDVLMERVDQSRANLLKAIPAQCAIDDGHVFAGFDAYKQVVAANVDLVILASPPGFRPAHLRAAVEAGKHIFTEKPVAVDPVGVRSVFESADLAAKKGLAIVAGTQRRHEPKYIETIRRLHEGAIGEIVAGQVYWNQGGLWKVDRKAGMSDVEWQVRNWLYFAWTSGDHIVEQHIHNIDVANWVLRGHPVRANGVGGRQVRVDPVYGHIFDHFAIELEYENGARILSMCRQQDGTARFVGEHFIGTRGISNASSWIRNPSEWVWPEPAEPVNPYEQEHRDLIASIKAGKPLNEGRQVAESTLSAIMAREAAYTGQVVTWDEILASDLDLTPPALAFGPMPVAPVAEPGVTRLSRPPFAHSRETTQG
jgi:predicted dehydrogenase